MRAAALRRFFADRYGVNGAAVTAADARRLMAPDFAEAEIALLLQHLEWLLNQIQFQLRIPLRYLCQLKKKIMNKNKNLVIVFVVFSAVCLIN